MPFRRVAILGAGPVGVEAALALLELGHEVRVYERDRIGAHLEQWGHVRLFSAFAINHSKRGVRVLEAEGAKLPGPDEYLTGAEHLERYLRPLATSVPLSGRIQERTRVLHVGRDGIGKNALIGGPRDRHPFRIFLERESGEELVAEADVVIDCTGTYGNPNRMGNGNLPARGERRLEKRIAYELRDVAGSERTAYEKKRVLLVGGGHSAATALDALRSLPETTVHWVARRPAPLDVIPDDPLPERKRLSELANALAAGSDSRVRFYPGATVESVREDGLGFDVELRTGEGTTHLNVDRILAHVGYRPDNSIYRELQVHECYASLAPMKLAAALLEESSADCLAQSSKGASTLRNPEPGFFILGAKSYGTNSNFLIRTGLEQIEEIKELLTLEKRRERAS